jgi:DNA-binding GntR family transcriptional regulator
MAAGTSNRPTLVEDLRRQLADEILEGILAPGVRLDEQELATRFHVSRTPVREALRQLAATGLVQERPRKGVVVTNVTRERMAEMFEAMAVLEASCARFSALRMTADEKSGLSRLHAQSLDLARAGDLGAYDQANNEFHSAIYAGCHNSFLEETALAIRQRVRPFRRAQFRVTGRLTDSWAEHDAVVRAILKSDGESAFYSMRAHVSAVGTASEDLLTRLPPFAPV